MEWLERMNAVLDYIENHLEDEINYEEIGQIALCHAGFFQRVFANLTSLPLSEYIRRRKLSKAGMDLKSTDEKIIDIAFKYGYESSDAFTFAFKRLHGVTPSEARTKGVPLKNYPKLSFTIIIKGDVEMNYKLIVREAFTVVGKSFLTTQEENMKENTISKYWTKCYQDGTVNKICSLGNKPLLGVCACASSDGSFNYLIAMETNKTDDSLETLVMPSSTWAVFEAVGPMPSAIQNVWNRIMTEFLPNGKYDHAQTPDFELYYPGDVTKDDYVCEVWIPVVLKK